MDKNEIAKELSKLGRQEARIMAKLSVVQAKRCEVLQSVAQSDEVDLSPDVAALTVAPKDED